MLAIGHLFLPLPPSTLIWRHESAILAIAGLLVRPARVAGVIEADCVSGRGFIIASLPPYTHIIPVYPKIVSVIIISKIEYKCIVSISINFHRLAFDAVQLHVITVYNINFHPIQVENQ